jgi:predicted phage terminase large subunit-like protein
MATAVDRPDLSTYRRLERVYRGVPDEFLDWAARVSPDYRWHWPHLRYLGAQLDRVSNGEVDRLIIQMPPRHGKSEATTIRYPVYRLAADPSLRIILGAYNATLAAKFSRKARRLADYAGIAIAEDRSAVEDWETGVGGGLRAVGVGGGITGQGGDLIIVDDPVKDREEAESETYRDKVWEWWTDVLWTRREPGAAVIVIMTRWHEDDLAGRILQSEDASHWTVVNLPALAEEHDPLGRAVGAALCPERFDENALHDTKTVIGDYGWSALYQGRPVPKGGLLFSRERAQIVDAVPAGGTVLRYWDKAGTEGGGDWTVGTKIRLHDGVYYVEDVTRAQVSAEARKALFRQTARVDGRSVSIVTEQEPGSGGKESAEVTIRDLAGYHVTADKVTGDPFVRCLPWAAQWQAGNVRLLRGDWNKAYLDEHAGYPRAKHDDQVTSSAGAFMRLTLTGVEVRIR